MLTKKIAVVRYWSVLLTAKRTGDKNSNTQHSFALFNLVYSPDISTALLIPQDNKYPSCHVYYFWLRWREIFVFYTKGGGVGGRQKIKLYVMLKSSVQVSSGFMRTWMKGEYLSAATNPNRFTLLTLLLGQAQPWALFWSSLRRQWEEREEVEKVEPASRCCLSHFALLEGKGCGGIATSALGEGQLQSYRNTTRYRAEPGSAAACKN